MADTLDYMFSSPWSGLVIYGVFGFFSILLSMIRFAWYREIQRDSSILMFSICNVFQGAALIGATLIIAPHPAIDFKFLLPWTRFSWLLCLLFFIVGTLGAWASLRNVRRQRKQALQERQGTSMGMF